LSTFVSDHDFVNARAVQDLERRTWPKQTEAPFFARNLHKNTQILSVPRIGAANWPGMVGAWGKSSPFSFDDHACHDGS
jgi:hypothetical protein